MKMKSLVSISLVSVALVALSGVTAASASIIEDHGGPDYVYTVDCTNPPLNRQWRVYLPTDTVTVNFVNCSSVTGMDVIQDYNWPEYPGGATDTSTNTHHPAPWYFSGASVPAQLVVDPNTEIEVTVDPSNDFDLYADLAQPLENPSGALLTTLDTTIPATPSVFSVTGITNDDDHWLGGIEQCGLEEGAHVYSATQVTVTKSGTYSFLVNNTSTGSDDLSSEYSWTPMNDPFLALYSTFDATVPDEGVVACDDDNVAINQDFSDGGYYPDGHIVAERWSSFTANLEPGTYTLMLSTWGTVSAADWVAGTATDDGDPVSFNAGPESASVQLWGPDGGLTPEPPKPELASTGVSSNGFMFATSMGLAGFAMLGGAAIARSRARARARARSGAVDSNS